MHDVHSYICWLVDCLRLHNIINLTTHHQCAQLATNKVYKHMHMQLYAMINGLVPVSLKTGQL